VGFELVFKRSECVRVTDVRRRQGIPEGWGSDGKRLCPPRCNEADSDSDRVAGLELA